MVKGPTMYFDHTPKKNKLKTHFENFMLSLIAQKKKSMKTKQQCVEFLVNIVVIGGKKKKKSPLLHLDWIIVSLHNML